MTVPLMTLEFQHCVVPPTRSVALHIRVNGPGVETVTVGCVDTIPPEAFVHVYTYVAFGLPVAWQV